jgi:CRP/FNR family transcriptional regulator, cyclic AMP receptor protein
MMYFVRSCLLNGNCRIFRWGDNGQQVCRRQALYSNNPTSALRESKLSFVGRSAFEAFGQSRPELYRHITTLLARRLRDTNEALVATNFLSVKGRVARALLSLAEAFGRDIGQGRILIREKVSQSDLAAMAGIARENVSRALNDWANRSLVSRLAGYYCLENQAALNREAEG